MAKRPGWYRLIEMEEEPPLDLALAWMAVEEGSARTVDAMLGDLDEIAAAVGLPLVDRPADDGVEVAAVPMNVAVARLHHTLFERFGFRGDDDDYDRPENSLLDQVLTRRRGLPILLSAVYLEVARRVGIRADGVGFPGHFLVSPRTEPRIWVDPFRQGRVLPRASLESRVAELDRSPPSRARMQAALAPVGSRYILARVENNLKGARLRRADVAGALRATDRLLALAPELIEELRDRGLMRAHLGDLEPAIADLELYLQRWAGAPDRARIEARIEQLRRASLSSD